MLKWDNEGSQAARKCNIVKILRGCGGILENMCFAKHRFTVQTIVTALRSPHWTYFSLIAVRRSFRVPGKTGWRHWLTKDLTRFCHSREPLQPDLLERQTRRCKQRALQKQFSQRPETTANYRSALIFALHSPRAPVKEQAELFNPTSCRYPQSWEQHSQLHQLKGK